MRGPRCHKADHLGDVSCSQRGDAAVDGIGALLVSAETHKGELGFDGDQQRADAVYTGMTPLTAADVAEVIGFVASRPPHVNLDQIIIRPRDQASATRKFTHPAAG